MRYQAVAFAVIACLTVQLSGAVPASASLAFSNESGDWIPASPAVTSRIVNAINAQQRSIGEPTRPRACFRVQVMRVNRSLALASFAIPPGPSCYANDSFGDEVFRLRGGGWERAANIQWMECRYAISLTAREIRQLRDAMLCP